MEIAINTNSYGLSLSIWIFIINDDDTVFLNRIKSKKWPIFVHTQNRKKIKAGDKIIFYKAGRNGQKFIGRAKLASDLKRTGGLDYYTDLAETEVWRKPVGVHDLLDALEFVKEKKGWGCFFQGGIRKISKTDYATISSAQAVVGE